MAISIAAAFETVIASRNYEVNELIEKIDAAWALDKITTDEHTNLTKEAQDNADVNNSLPDLTERVASLEQRVAILEGSGSAATAGGDEGSSDWPEWVKPTSIDKAYSKGAQVTHNGKKYTSKIDLNMLTPGVMGWSEVTE